MRYALGIIRLLGILVVILLGVFSLSLISFWWQNYCTQDIYECQMGVTMDSRRKSSWPEIQ